MAALTSLGPSHVTDNPRCPVKECHKTDTLVCCSYNAAALAILLEAIRKTVSPRIMTPWRWWIRLLLPTLNSRVTLAQQCPQQCWRRQVWLAQTTLPERIGKDLVKMPVVPGMVFHPDSQGLFESAEQSRQTRESVHRTFSSVRGPLHQPRGPHSLPQQSWPRERQSEEYVAPRGVRLPRHQPAYQQCLFPRARPQRQRPPRAMGSRGNNP